MIALLRGALLEKSPHAVVVDVGGVGYEVHIPLSTFPRLPDLHKSVSFHTYTHVREDTLQLFGFFDRGERDFFLLLLSVSGIGPRLALNILSGLPLGDLAKAIEAENVDRLRAIPGVGAKTAGRVILELKGKLPATEPTSGSMQERGDRIPADALSALMNLGYSRATANDAVDRVTRLAEDSPVSLEDVIREALRMLVK